MNTYYNTNYNTGWLSGSSLPLGLLLFDFWFLSGNNLRIKFGRRNSNTIAIIIHPMMRVNIDVSVASSPGVNTPELFGPIAE